MIKLYQIFRNKKNEINLSKHNRCFFRIFSYTKDNKIKFILGAFVAVINGLIFPLLSILIARTLTSLAKFPFNPVQARKDCNFYGLLYLLLAVLSLCVNTIQAIIFYPIG
jgi:hypothetical protein